MAEPAAGQRDETSACAFVLAPAASVVVAPPTAVEAGALRNARVALVASEATRARYALIVHIGIAVFANVVFHEKTAHTGPLWYGKQAD